MKNTFKKVFIGFMAFGIQPSHQDIEEKVFIPNANNFEVYQNNFIKFKKVYEALKDL
jgi:sugar (pentulose or hexulose) kinase